MTWRQIYRTILAAALFTAIPFSSVTAITAAQKAQQAQAAVAAAEQQKLTNLKTRGALELDRRLASLSAAYDKLQDSKRLTAANKTALSTQVSAEIAALQALKTKLAADATLADARADVASIVTDYRVYALMLPKVRLINAIDRLTAAQTKLTEVLARLEAQVASAKTAGKPVTAAETSLITLRAKLASSQAKIDDLTDKLLALEPTDYNANHAVLLGYRASVAASRDDLKAAAAEAHNLDRIIKDLATATPSPKPSPNSKP